MPTFKQRAARLEQARKAVSDAAGGRRATRDGRWDGAHPSYGEWENCVDAFWAAGRAMYPDEFWEARERLRVGDAREADYFIEFLEADPICFRSGYIKAEDLQ